MLGDDLRHWSDYDYGPWAVIDDESGEYLGRVGLHETTVEGIPEVELAWTIDPDRSPRARWPRRSASATKARSSTPGCRT